MSPSPPLLQPAYNPCSTDHDVHAPSPLLHSTHLLLPSHPAAPAAIPVPISTTTTTASRSNLSLPALPEDTSASASAAQVFVLPHIPSISPNTSPRAVTSRLVDTAGMENGVGSHASPPNGEVVNGKSWSKLFFIGKDGKERKQKGKKDKDKGKDKDKDMDGVNPSPKSVSSTTLDSASLSALSAIVDADIPPSPKSSKSAFATLGGSKTRSKSRFSYSSNKGTSSPSIPQATASPSASPLVRDRANRHTGMSSSSGTGAAASADDLTHTIATTQNSGIAQNITVQIGNSRDKHRAGDSCELSDVLVGLTVAATSVEDTNKATNNFQSLASRANNNEATLASLLPPDLISDGASENGSVRSSVQARVPSRQLLQAALDLAQRAVEMDKGNDVAGALAAYREAVTKLRVVMERVGVEPSGDGKRPKNDDEGRTLRGIVSRASPFHPLTDPA